MPNITGDDSGIYFDCYIHAGFTRTLGSNNFSQVNSHATLEWQML